MAHFLWKRRIGLVVRWTILLVLTLLLAFQGEAGPGVLALLALLWIWNSALTFSDLLGFRYLGSANVALIGDSVIAAGLFLLGGTLTGPMVWAGLLPVSGAALQFQIMGGVTASLAVTSAFALMALVNVAPSDILGLLSLPAGAFFLAAVILGALGLQVDQLAGKDRELDLGKPLKLSEADRRASIHDRDRKQLAHNIHNGLTQSIAAIAMRASLARRMVGKDTAGADKELLRVEEMARETTREIRHLLFTLSPGSLESNGLVSALQDLAKQIEDTYLLDVHLDVDKKHATRLDHGRQGVLFFIALEALTNIRKHALAQNAWVRLKLLEGETLLFEVEDDGLGFEVEALEKKQQSPEHLGLVNMRERVELLNGRMRLQNQDGGGTLLQVWVPLSEQAAAVLQYGG